MLPNKGARVKGEYHILQELGDTVEGECCPINVLE